jgi:hypothetical protein
MSSPFISFTYYCRFSAKDFLARLKGKKLMLVGDSMNRNQYESILCILREGLQNKSKMYEIHGHKISKGRGYFVFKFEVIFIFSCIFRSVQAPITCPTLYYFFWGKNNPFSVIYSLPLKAFIDWEKNCLQIINPALAII